MAIPLCSSPKKDHTQQALLVKAEEVVQDHLLFPLSAGLLPPGEIQAMLPPISFNTRQYR